MRVLLPTALVGVASAAFTPSQQILNAQEHVSSVAGKAAESVSSTWSKGLQDLNDALNSMTSEARQVWDEVATMFPEAMDKANFLSMPKAHVRKHDSEWDHIVRGSDIQGMWTTNAQGDRERVLDGKLENYDMRVKKVDPKELGVDTVKQYSGYLDDNENDKHLFYCESKPSAKGCHTLLHLSRVL